MKTKKPSESVTQMTYMVLPNNTNTLGNLMGGDLLSWMDITAAIAAGRHSNRVVVTASIDTVDFRAPASLGEIIIITAKVTRAFNSSMEIMIEVYAENQMSGLKHHCNTAYFTFVAVDQAGNPLPVNGLVPETDLEKLQFEQALSRREARLAQIKKQNVGASC